MITPICARSLSFRPIILPPDVLVELKISNDSRVHTGVCSFDGLPSINVRFTSFLFYIFLLILICSMLDQYG